MRNRTVIGIICIIAAIAVSFGIAPLTNRILDNKTDIVRVKTDIQEGRMIEESDIEVVSVGSYNLPAGVITDAGIVVGKYATVSLFTGDYLLPEKLKSAGNTASDVLEALDAGHQAMSITVPSFASGLSGKLKNGDIISIIIYSDRLTFTPPELKYVKIITTTTSDGLDNDEVDGKSQPATVTLLVTREQAELLTEYENSATIHLSLISRSDGKEAEKYLKEQKEYLKSIEKGTVMTDE